MQTAQLKYEIKARKLALLVNSLKTSTWSSAILGAAYVYFYWGHASSAALLLWLTAHISLSLGRTFIIFPIYEKTKISEDNVDTWWNGFTLSLFFSGFIWGFGFPFFFVPDNTQLLVVLMFAFFTLLVSATINLASHAQGFIVHMTPLVGGAALLLVNSGGRFYQELGIALIFFTLIIANFYRITHQEITNMIRLQLEKQDLAKELEQQNILANESREIAEKSVRDKNQFLAAASHDLRQPLHASGLLLSALEKHVDSEQGKQLLIDISNSNQALTNSFNSLLDMSKLDAESIEINMAHLSLPELIGFFAGEFQAQAQEKNVELHFDGEQAVVYSDQNLLTRVLRNLISNAIRYTDAGSIEIKWSSSDVDDSVVINVTDTGIGIASSERENIFSEYYQVDNPERDQNKGFGLGLSIVQRLCAMLNIELNLQSEIGIGSTFTLKLPRGDATRVIERNPERQLSIGKTTATILIIDDDSAVLNSMQKLLVSWGLNVYCCDSGEAAKELVADAEPQPDLILADFRLRNGKNGVEACELIFEELNRELPAAIITGDTSPQRLMELKESGYQVLHKPVAPGELRSLIQRAVSAENPKR